jgi:hypothetical protein
MNPTDKLTVTLEAKQWNTLMQVLGEGPFRIVAPLIQDIQKQCNMHAGNTPDTAQRGNGADDEQVRAAP